MLLYVYIKLQSTPYKSVWIILVVWLQMKGVFLTKISHHSDSIFNIHTLHMNMYALQVCQGIGGVRSPQTRTPINVQQYFVVFCLFCYGSQRRFQSKISPCLNSKHLKVCVICIHKHMQCMHCRRVQVLVGYGLTVHVLLQMYICILSSSLALMVLLAIDVWVCKYSFLLMSVLECNLWYYGTKLTVIKQNSIHLQLERAGRQKRFFGSRGQCIFIRCSR
eukprot:TRINITY_DN3554_c0_g1_i1.p1 TRINITY_DN3554_c0_g1~~TRINITY_DN3554_c0_g1_i1.p1  ORF type:complete len:220 (-),score=-16.78 TRINITY_DN3554_c0_g1_i1:295-954(-)